MEVHRHAHTPRHKWTHYFWEFLMLFLAVFAGFLAENFREHYVENKRAGKLATTLYDEICSDTANLSQVMSHTRLKLLHLDSLIHDLHQAPGSWNDTAMTRHIFWLARFQTFERSRSTFDQLKNSGSLRYFNQDLVKLLNAYDVLAQEIRLREEVEYTGLSNRVIPLCMQLINFEQVYAYSFNEPYTGEVYVRISDREKADYLVSETAGIKIVRTRLKILYEKLQQQAAAILERLGEEYR